MGVRFSNQEGFEMKIKVYHNGDDVFIAWKPDGKIPDCRGFALYRRRNGVEGVVSTWVGFEGQASSEGERRASTNWPIQKYQWSDYMADPGDRLQYRVVPMIGPNKDSLRGHPELASDWTEEITLNHQVAEKIEVYFNRGIVAAQWVSRRLGITAQNTQAKKLATIIDTPNDPFRAYLFGPLGKRLFELLDSAAKEKREIYAALFELNDKQIESALVKLGKRANVVLANGSVKKKGGDENQAARRRLKNKIHLYNRMISPRALGHNKFCVFCDKKHNPRWVWTGSQNWSKTGLCSQANNSILIDNPALAREYKKQWDLLKNFKNATPKELKESNDHPRDLPVAMTPLRLWFTPTIGLVDLTDASKLIANAKQAILFLMFNPGPKGTLLNDIIAKAQQSKVGNRLYIRGVLNQDPGTKKNPVRLFQSHIPDAADFRVVLPAAIDKFTAYWEKELLKLPKTFAMVHSKVVLIDPFGKHPILLTGSHNLGPKASGTNDENLLIIKDCPGLASAYATNIMSIYNQYRWRFRRKLQPASKCWKGLKDNDTWQDGYLKPGSDALSEIKFWVGE
jgi:phosphatidylserine/phosphatidylglycerophosphate/cardiolipin synthase-like enzyme